MAWTDTCKIAAVNTVEKKVGEAGSIRAACEVVAKESGIPAETLRDWCKKSDKASRVGEDSPVKQKAGDVLRGETEGPTPQSEVWVSVGRRLGTLEKFMRKNCEMPVEIDEELRTIIKYRIGFIKDTLGDGDSDA